MTLDGLGMVARLGRLSAVESQARSRVARLLAIGDMEARAVLLMAGDTHLTLAELGRHLRLSRGGAVALAKRLSREALVVFEPDPDDRRSVRLRLRDGVQDRLAAALAGLTERLDAITAELTTADRRAIATYVDEIVATSLPVDDVTPLMADD